MPRTMGGKSGLVRSGMTTPTVPDFDVFNPRAIGFGRYPSDSATLMTRRAVSALTSPRVAGLSAREAVAGWTPAASATSRSVGVCTGGILEFPLRRTRPTPTLPSGGESKGYGQGGVGRIDDGVLAGVGEAGHDDGGERAPDEQRAGEERDHRR